MNNLFTLTIISQTIWRKLTLSINETLWETLNYLIEYSMKKKKKNKL